jgi:hypothetical protein
MRKRIRKAIGAILLFVGFFVIVGAIGNDDYHTIEIGISYPLSETLKIIGYGALFLVIGGWFSRIWEYLD